MFFCYCGKGINIIALYNMPKWIAVTPVFSHFLQGYFQAPVLFGIGRWIRCQWDRFSTFGVCVVYNICRFLIKQIDMPRLSRSVNLDKDVNKGEEAVLEDNA